MDLLELHKQGHDLLLHEARHGAEPDAAFLGRARDAQLGDRLVHGLHHGADSARGFKRRLRGNDHPAASLEQLVAERLLHAAHHARELRALKSPGKGNGGNGLLLDDLDDERPVLQVLQCFCL